MSQELAAKSGRRNEVPLYDFFSPLESIIENTIPTEGFVTAEILGRVFTNLRENFQHDYSRVADVHDLLFGDDLTAYGTRATAVFTRWEREGGGPALTALVAHAVEAWHLDSTAPEVRAAFLAAVAAEIPNGLQYHGNEHYRKVLFHTIRLVSAHNQLNPPGTRLHLDRMQAAILLAASCIHDLGHEGGDNLRDGVYTPGWMEQKAFDIIRPYFNALGVDPDFAGQIETIVFCTDITFFAGEKSPCIRLKKIYKNFFWGDESEDVSMMLLGKLRRFDDNPLLVLMGMILHEADVATSAGISYEQTVRETINIMEERGVKTAGPRVVLSFLREQLGETMFTEASKQLFGAVMTEVIAQAEQDILAGRDSFYTR